MKIAVIGAGAMGSIYASFLAKNNNDVLAIDLWEEHLHEIKKNGLRVSGFSGDNNVKNIKVAKNAHKLLDEEAKRIVESMPPWRIGKIDGEAQEFSFKLPITFRLPSS